MTHKVLLTHRNALCLELLFQARIDLTNPLLCQLIILNSYKLLFRIRSFISLQKHRDEHLHALVHGDKPNHIHAFLLLCNVSYSFNDRLIRSMKDKFCTFDVSAQNIRQNAELLWKVNDRRTRESNDLAVSRIGQQTIE